MPPGNSFVWDVHVVESCKRLKERRRLKAAIQPFESKLGRRTDGSATSLWGQ